MYKNLQMTNESNDHVLEIACEEGGQMYCEKLFTRAFSNQFPVLVLYVMAASAGLQLALELTLAKDNDDPSEDAWGSWHTIEWDFFFFSLSSFSLFCESHKEILNHTCSTGIFVECMLVTFLLLEPLCKISFVALRSSFVFFAVLASPLSRFCPSVS